MNYFSINTDTWMCWQNLLFPEVEQAGIDSFSLVCDSWMSPVVGMLLAISSKPDSSPWLALC